MLFSAHLLMLFDLDLVCSSMCACLSVSSDSFSGLSVCSAPLLPILSVLKMEDLFIQHVNRRRFPGCFVRELGCLWQQAEEALGTSSPLVRLYPSRLSNTGLGSCHKAGWPWDKLLFLHQNNEETHKQTASKYIHAVALTQTHIQITTTR